ncbi:FecCD family ABC transporter permease [Metamycoplasma equirhinis]|uniref:FecCD family ABC transporter permease n=1 Tax=Metamycoplasma equirhinis TaxID=92402 RepID=UPI0035937442
MAIQNKKINFSILWFSFGVIFTIFIFFLGLMVGRFNIPIQIFFKILLGYKEEYTNYYNTIVLIRLPRTLIALLVGISLTLAGIIYQQLFNNNLVSPSILGVSNGASVGAALCIFAGLSGIYGNIIISIAAFAFGILSMILTILLSKLFKSNKGSVSLILAGIIVSGFMTSLISIIKTISDVESTLPSIVFWTMGSFSKTNMTQFWILFFIVVPCFITLIILRWRISLIGLGKIQAQSKGLNYNFYKFFIIIIGSILVSASVATSGSIAWVGLVIPNLLKIIFKADIKKSIVFAIPFGGSFMIIVDILSRSFTSLEIPISGITGIICLLIMIGIFLINIRKGQTND